MTGKSVAITANTAWYIYNFRRELILALQAEGFRIITVAPTYIDEYAQKLINMGCEHYNVDMDNMGTNPGRDIRTFFHFYSIYRRARPDIALHFTIKPNIYGTLAARLLNIPAINNISGLGTLFIKETVFTTIAEWLYRLSQYFAKKIFFQNIDDMSMFLSRKLVPESRVELLPGSGVDIERFRPMEKTEQSDKFVFLLIARMLKDKGIVEYVEAAKIIRDKYPLAEFQLLGFMDDKNRTAITYREMGEWVQAGLVNYLGPTDRVEDFIRNADCVVLPSYREGTPRSLLEAAAMAKPIVTTAVPGCRNVVDDGINGFLCPAKNVLKLADALERVLVLTPEERTLMGQKGREKIERAYNINLVLEKYISSIHEILVLSRRSFS